VKAEFHLRKRVSRHRLWLLLLPLLLACNLSISESTPVPIKTATTPAETVMAGQPPTKSADVTATSGDQNNNESPGSGNEVPEPTGAPVVNPSPSGPLPAPLYFINLSGQISRLETDGLTLTQITNEPLGVTDFDVSPGTGRIAYVSDNNLIETDLYGGDILVMVAGGPIVDDDTGAAYITQTIDRPRYAPDGSLIAFGLNGINLIASGQAAEHELILPNDPYPDFNDPNFTFPEDPTLFFWPESWSPNGGLLQLQYGTYPEGGGVAVIDPNTGQGNLVFNPEFIECCDWTWSRDSQSAFVASDLFIYGSPGLAQVDPFTGDSWTMIDGYPAGEMDPSPGNPMLLFRQAMQDSDDSLLTFISVQENIDDYGSGFQMHHIPPGGDPIPFPMRDDLYNMGDVLWAPDGSGAIIVDLGGEPSYPATGVLRWLPADGQPALLLPAEGYALRWGG
jgi:hypothetical protein